MGQRANTIKRQPTAQACALLEAGLGPHDKLFRRLMRERGVAEALLRERLPRALSSRLAGPPELLAESFVGASMRGVMADVVLRAPLVGGTHAVVYCVVEHKRAQHPRALLQVLEYLNALSQHLGRVTPPGPLPMVVPIVIHNGVYRWNGPTRFSELLADCEWARPYVLDFEVILIDVAAEPMQRLSAHPKLRGALQGLRASAFSGRPLVRAVEQVLSNFEGDESTQNFFLRYLMNVVGPQNEKALRAASSKSRSSAMQTLANFYKSQGRKEGQRIGQRLGRDAAAREAVRRVLLKRFKRIPSAIETRLDEADAATLLRWLDAALDARSLRAVFATH